jgi:hypothetical protein
VPQQARGGDFTYSSKQATKCAGCGDYKHTPLRVDAMGGYVCLTCIDNKLGMLLGEFGYPDPPVAPASQPAEEPSLTAEQEDCPLYDAPIDGVNPSSTDQPKDSK